MFFKIHVMVKMMAKMNMKVNEGVTCEIGKLKIDNEVIAEQFKCVTLQTLLRHVSGQQSVSRRVHASILSVCLRAMTGCA